MFSLLSLIMPTMPIVLALNNVALSRGARTLYSQINLTMMEGESGLLLGPSGSGKSSLFALITGHLKADHGEIMVLGQNVAAMGKWPLAVLRRKVATIYQGYQLIPDYSVLDNILLNGYFTGRVDKTAALEALDRLGLVGFAQRRGGELSGGEQQRVAIARALYSQAPMVLADEPTGNLDDNSAELVVKALEKLAQSGKTLLIATHDSRLKNHFPVVLELCGA